MNNTTSSTLPPSFEREFRDYFEDNPLNINSGQLLSFKYAVFLKLITESLDEAEDEIHIVAQAVAKERGYIKEDNKCIA